MRSSIISTASRHFGRWCSVSGIRHLRRRRRTAAASLSVVAASSSQLSGMYSRQSNGADAASVTACTLTATWQFPILPKVPEYCRATHADAVPSLACPVSSMTHACGSITPIANRANVFRTGTTSHGELVTNCCSRW